ncbi:HIT family protein [archaeon]|nr:HIT family protein [archaeon]
MAECIFCKIISKEIPCALIYEDEHIIAFLDINPATKYGGHTLVMPKKHYELFTDLSGNELHSLALALKKISAALLKFGEGLNMLQNNRAIAGQAIPHVHFHLIPRFKDDNVKIHYWEPHKYSNNEIESIRKKIISLLPP